MSIDTRNFSFKSLRTDAEFEEKNAPTGLSPWTDNNSEVRGGKGGGVNGNQCISYVLVPLGFVAFVTFAIAGTTAVATTIYDQDHAASLIGGKMNPKPPPPPPASPRPPSPPPFIRNSPPPPAPLPPWQDMVR